MRLDRGAGMKTPLGRMAAERRNERGAQGYSIGNWGDGGFGASWPGGPGRPCSERIKEKVARRQRRKSKEARVGFCEIQRGLAKPPPQPSPGVPAVGVKLWARECRAWA